MRNSKVLITGGCGFIGKHLRKKLVETGKEVVVLDIAAPESGTVDGCLIVRGDICDSRLVGELVRNIDTVYHLAAVSTFRECQDDPRKALQVNVKGTATVLREAARSNAGSFVFFSSASVYSGNEELAKHERMLLLPQSVYGLTKLSGEALCGRDDDRRYGPPLLCSCLRLFNVYGEGGRGVVDKFARATRKDKRIIVYGDGSQVRDYIHVEDVVKAAMVAGEGRLAGVFNVGTGRSCSLSQLKGIMERIAGVAFEVEERPRDLWDVQETIADSKKMMKYLLPTPMLLEEGLTGLLAGEMAQVK